MRSSRRKISHKFVNLIAVRMKSTRLNGKALRDLCGKPLLWHIVDRVSRARIPENTVICTSRLSDDDPIQDFAERYGFEVFRGDPDDVMRRFICAAESRGSEHVVRITGDNPLTDPEFIDAMTSLHLKEGAEYTFTEDPPRGTRPEIMSLAGLKKCHNLADDPNFTEYMTLYFMNHNNVFKTVRYRAKSKSVIRPEYLVTVDTQADFEVVQQIYEALYGKNRKFTLHDVVSFLDIHPEIDHAGRKKPPLDFSKINIRLKVG